MQKPKEVEGLKGPFNLETEEWREYDSGDRVYRITRPEWLYIGKTTHRVIDSEGVTHCLRGPEAGVVLRWFAPKEAVSF